MDYILKHPLQSTAVGVGSALVVMATGFLRHGDSVSSLITGALGLTLLITFEIVMLRNADWGILEEWGTISENRRERLNVLLVALGALAVGTLAAWIGFGPVLAIAQILFIAGGWLVFVAGVFSLATWLKAEREFNSPH